MDDNSGAAKLMTQIPRKGKLRQIYIYFYEKRFVSNLRKFYDSKILSLSRVSSDKNDSLQIFLATLFLSRSLFSRIYFEIVSRKNCARDVCYFRTVQLNIYIYRCLKERKRIEKDTVYRCCKAGNEPSR